MNIIPVDVLKLLPDELGQGRQPLGQFLVMG